MRCAEAWSAVRWEDVMPRVIEAVYEDGVIKPLETLDLKEHQRVRVVITSLPGTVAGSRGLIPAEPELLKEVAESDEFLPS
jgi:predicted DNA-binding antitoxin AbrB/MazE fold protein